MAEATRDRRLVFNLGVLGASQVITQLVNLGSLILVARLLGVERFGLVQVGVAVSAYALLSAEMGLMSLGIREVARIDDVATIARYVRVHLGLLTTLAVVVWALAALVLPLAPFFEQGPLLFLLYAAFVFPQVLMFDWLTTGLQQMKWTGAYGVIRSAIYATCVVLALPHLGGFLGVDQMTWVPMLYILAFFLADVVVAWRVGRWLGAGALRPSFGPASAWRSRLVEAAPIGVSMVVMRVLLNVDVLILGILADAETVGVYAAASKILVVLIAGATVAWKVLLPRLAQSWTTCHADFHRDFRRFTATALALLAPIAAGGYTVGSRFIELLYDDRFVAAGPMFELLSIAYALLALGIFFGNGLIASDRQRAYLPSVSAAAACVVVLNLWLVPMWGARGAAWAVLISATLLALLTGWQMRASLRDRSFLTPVAIVGVATVVMTGVVRWTADKHVTVSILVGAISYAILAGPWLWRLLRARPSSS